MSHPLVAALQAELAWRRADLADAVRQGRLRPALARATYDRLAAVLEFLHACASRFDAEAAYAATPTVPDNSPILAALAQGDGEMRRLWAQWATHEDDSHEHKLEHAAHPDAHHPGGSGGAAGRQRSEPALG